MKTKHKVASAIVSAAAAGAAIISALNTNDAEAPSAPSCAGAYVYAWGMQVCERGQ